MILNTHQHGRLIFPDDHCIVVFDTSPLRNLAYADKAPNWIATFQQMSKDGYSFCLSDSAFAELLSQHARGAIPDTGFRRMLDWIKPILTPKTPILLGKRDILEIIRCPTKDAAWSVDEFHRLSELAWQTLTGSIKQPQEFRINAEPELQEERSDWICLFKQMSQKADSTKINPTDLNESGGPILNAMLSSINAECDCTPPMSIRMDLQLRFVWRQYVRSKKTIEPYNPESLKKRNDGIDFDLYKYFLLPAFVVAEDKGFFSSLEGIKSFQRDWFFKPEELANEWQKGTRPFPRWPLSSPHNP